MSRPLICTSCGFPIGLLIFKYRIEGHDQIEFDTLEKEINVHLKACCRMKMMTFVVDF
jgi:DNA-directed RNA polymerase subunit N (RpoN/RPB10)